MVARCIKIDVRSSFLGSVVRVYMLGHILRSSDRAPAVRNFDDHRDAVGALMRGAEQCLS